MTLDGISHQTLNASWRQTTGPLIRHTGNTVIIVVIIAAWRHGLRDQSRASGGYGHGPSVVPIRKVIRVTDARRFHNGREEGRDVHCRQE